MLREMKIEDFLDELASESPAPGGGSVSALVSANGAGLAEMVCNLTIGKKKYADVEEEMRALRDELHELRLRLTELIDRDTEAFNLVMDAIGMPKETEEQKAKRRKAMQEAFKKASEIPLETAQVSFEAMKRAVRVREIGNRNAASDADIAVMLCDAGMKGAMLNVRINLDSIKDEEFVAEMERSLKVMEEEAVRLLA